MKDRRARGCGVAAALVQSRAGQGARVDVRQCAWVLIQTADGELVVRCYNLGTQELTAVAKIGPYKAVDMTLGTRLSAPLGRPPGINATSTAFVHVLVSSN
jgi:hypothetical protein